MGSLCSKSEPDMSRGSSKPIHKDSRDTHDDNSFSALLDGTTHGEQGDLFKKRRMTNAPNMKNFKNLKQIKNINNIYTFGKVLGKGSFGDVMMATRKGASNQVAMKIVKKASLNNNPMLPQLMLSELSVLQKCAHGNIMSVSELLEDDDCFYIACELLEGGELFERIIQVQHFNEQKAANIVNQVLLALNYMHSQNITHRDLKPENILLESKDVDKLDVKIADFGFSCFFDPNKGLDLVLGSPLYMAPEIIEISEKISKAKIYNEKVDLWSLGVICYMLLTGRNPFPGKNKAEVKQLIISKDIDYTKEYLKNLSKEAKDFLQCALVRDPTKRYSAKQLLDHPWLSNKDSLKTKIDDKTKNEISSNLANFSKTDKFQKTVISLLIGLRTDKKDLKKLQNAFQSLDKDQNGFLDGKEFKEAAKVIPAYKFQQGWEDVFKQVDLDGDGKIDFHEFMTGAVDHQKTLTKKNLEFLFNMFDENNDGIIELEEFKHSLPTQIRNTVMEVPKKEKNRGQRQPVSEDTQDDEKWKEIIAAIDTNGDGKVSFQEFHKAVEKFLLDGMITK